VPIISAHARSLARRVLSALALALLLGASLATPSAHAGLGEDCSRIRDRAGSATVEVGVVIVDLADGARCELGEETVFRTASLYKLLVMAEAYEQEAEGTLAFDEELELLPRHYINDPPGTQPAATVTLTARRAMQLMIQQSDNATAHALRERLTHGEVQGHAVQLGMAQTSLDDHFVTSPADVAIFFEQLYAGDVVSPEASAAMLSLLSGQQIRNLLPEGLPDGLPIAHKTGLLEDYLHDAGIVQAAGGDYVIVALARHDGDFPAAYDAIRGISALVYEGFAAPVADPLVVAPPMEGAAAASSASDGSPSAAAAAPSTAVPAATSTAAAAAASGSATNASASASPPAAIDIAPSGSSTAWWRQPTGLGLLAALAALAALVALVPGIALATGRAAALFARDRVGARGRGLAREARPPRFPAPSFSARRGDRRMRFVKGREQQQGETEVAAGGLGVSSLASLASARLQRIGAYFVSN